MTLRVGVDDTDSPRGGCTTFVLTELLAGAAAHGLDLIGAPRLVRLNPNVPWKTRGNAALSAAFGVGRGSARSIGSIRGRPVRAYPSGRAPPAGPAAAFLDDAWEIVLRGARRGEAGTDPALVAVRRALPARLYWEAVREIVDPDRVRSMLADRSAWVRVDGSDRGIVGAAAAIAWPGRRATWEAISYRDPARVGRPRRVDVGSVRAAQREEPALFLCHDPRTRRMLVAPHTPCPILFGLRSRTAAAALRARPRIRSEPVERWVLFRTNQGSGDHLVRRDPAAWPPGRSGWFDGRLVGEPIRLPGGHVTFSVRSGPSGPPIPCIAFEPTKTLPAVARRLVDGDLLRLWGSRGDRPTIRLEAIEVRRARTEGAARRPPICPACRRSARSLGRCRGYRCPTCRHRWPPDAARRLPRPAPPPPGRVDPTPSARRHLAPLGPEPAGPPGPYHFEGSCDAHRDGRARIGARSILAGGA